MADEPKRIVRTLLDSVHDSRVVAALCAPDVTYVSLNYSNPDLHKIMPWCGTGQGAERIIKTFRDVAEFWDMDSFQPEIISEKEKTLPSSVALRIRRRNCGKQLLRPSRSSAK